MFMVAVLATWMLATGAMAAVVVEHPAACHHNSAGSAGHQHGAMQGHACCKRPVKTAPVSTKRCCPHPEGLAPRTCEVSGPCCRVEAREVSSTRQERAERKSSDQRISETGTRSRFQIAALQRSRTLLLDGLRYERPVTELKTDLRI